MYSVTPRSPARGFVFALSFDRSLVSDFQELLDRKSICSLSAPEMARYYFLPIFLTSDRPGQTSAVQVLYIRKSALAA
jgi:hypothetical protein